MSATLERAELVDLADLTQDAVRVELVVQHYPYRTEIPYTSDQFSPRTRLSSQGITLEGV